MKNAILLLTLAACAKGPWPRATIQVDGRPISVEIANTADLRERGLMDRDALPADEGMLFMYPEERNRSFWMKRTRIPLDIAFADSNGIIVRIAQMQPYTTEKTPSLVPAQYALEMNEGWFGANGVVVGDAISDWPAEIEAEVE